MVHAIRHSGVGLTDWLIRAKQPNVRSDKVKRDGNPDGPLFGETVVFTGTLSLKKSQMAEMAGEMGCDVANDVTRATTLVVVGNQDIRQLAGHSKSSKHRKAEALREKGLAIRVISESDFQRIVKSAKELANA
jgi:DNA polymerase-3 subunit epsilon